MSNHAGMGVTYHCAVVRGLGRCCFTALRDSFNIHAELALNMHRDIATQSRMQHQQEGISSSASRAPVQEELELDLQGPERISTGLPCSSSR